MTAAKDYIVRSYVSDGTHWRGVLIVACCSEVMKRVRLSRHAQEQLPFRGGTKEEVDEAIRNSPWQPAELGRLECRRNFVFQQH